MNKQRQSTIPDRCTIPPRPFYGGEYKVIWHYSIKYRHFIQTIQSLYCSLFFYSLQKRNIPSEFTQESVAVKWYSSVMTKHLTFIVWATVIHKAINQPLNIIKLRVQMSVNAKSRTFAALSTNACICVYTCKHASVKHTNTHTINRSTVKLNCHCDFSEPYYCDSVQGRISLYPNYKTT